MYKCLQLCVIVHTNNRCKSIFKQCLKNKDIFHVQLILMQYTIAPSGVYLRNTDIHSLGYDLVLDVVRSGFSY